MDDGKPYNKEFVDNYFDYVQYAFICIDLLRFVTILISYKWIGITRYYIYLHSFSLCLLHTLPQDYGD